MSPGPDVGLGAQGLMQRGYVMAAHRGASVAALQVLRLHAYGTVFAHIGQYLLAPTDMPALAFRLPHPSTSGLQYLRH